MRRIRRYLPRVSGVGGILGDSGARIASGTAPCEHLTRLAWEGSSSAGNGLAEADRPTHWNSRTRYPCF